MTNSWVKMRLGLALLAAAAAGLSAGAQNTEEFHGLKVVELHPVATPTPFPLDVHTGRVDQLQFLAPEQMTAADRDLVASNAAEIARRASLQGFHLAAGRPEDGGWGFEQAVCPVFPAQVVLEYSRSNGNGDVSLFSVVIPRGEGHVRVIPVRRRSYSLWTPAASNALTLHDFNRLVKDGGLSPDWLTTSLCYAALAGGHVRAALQPRLPAEEHYPLLAAAKLTVSRFGGAQVLIADTTPQIKSMDWKFDFAQDGQLLRVRHEAPSALVEKSVPGTAAEVRGKPVVGNAEEVGVPRK